MADVGQGGFLKSATLLNKFLVDVASGALKYFWDEVRGSVTALEISEIIRVTPAWHHTAVFAFLI